MDRHGTEAPVGRRARAERWTWSARWSAGHPYLEAEIAWAVEREGALSLDDLLARRIRLVHVLRDRGEAIAPRVASIVAPALGWASGAGEVQIATFLAAAHREFDVPRGE